MPLGRFTVRNEYGLGVKELYKEGVESEDPKAVLDGVAVAGLVGLLRQLGDLSQFAAEVFHGLQEQVASTVSRSRKLVARVQHIEASLPSLEKAILSQTSHIHFAYSPGSEWHPRIKNEQNHFICDDLPHFIMDSYEECHEPPRLQLLDRFDKSGPGSCLQRYSDPTFFRRTSASSVACNKEKSQLERKIRKIKRRRSRQRSERFSSCVPTMNNSERMQSSSQTGEVEPSLSNPGSTINKRSVSDREEQSESVSSINSTQLNKSKNDELSSTVDENMADKGVQGGLACHNNVPHCSDVTWDEKLEIMEHMCLNYGVDDVQHVPETDYFLHQKDIKPVSTENNDQVDDFSEDQLIEPSGHDFLHEHGVKIDDAKNSQGDDISEITSCTESDADVHCLRRTTNEKFLDSTRQNYFYEQQLKPINIERPKSNAHGKYPTTILDWDMDTTTQKDNGIDEAKDFDLHEHYSVQMYAEPFPQLTNFSEGKETHADDLVLANLHSFPQVMQFSEGGNPPKFTVNGNFVDDSFGRKLRIGDVQYMLETIENNKWALETIKPEQVGISSAQGLELSNGDNRLGISNGHYALESKLEDAKLEEGTMGEQYDGPVDTSAEEVNNMNLIEWPNHDDIDSETDNFVDALNTIDSESESENESQTKTVVAPSLSKWKLLENGSTNQLTRYDSKDEVYPECPESSVSFHQQQAATSQEQEQETQIPPTLGIDNTLTEKQVDSPISKCNLTGNASTSPMVENIKQFQLEHDFHSRMYNINDQVYDHSEQPISLENTMSMPHTERATGQEQDVLPCFPQGTDETLTKEQVDPPASKNKPLGKASSDLLVENKNQLESQHQFHYRMYDTNDGVYDGSGQEYLENAVSSHQSSGETSHELDGAPYFSREQSAQIPSSLSIVSQAVDVCVKTDEIRLQPPVCKPVESSSQASEVNRSVELPFGSTNSYPHALWTNGTLFGLQPSKPIVVSTSNSAPMSNGPGTITSTSVKNIVGEDVRSVKRESRDGLDKKCDKSLDHNKRNINDDSAVPGVSYGQSTCPECKVPSSDTFESVHSEANSTSEDRSSLLSLLARNLLNNGVRRSASLDYNDGKKSNYVAALDPVPQSNLKSTFSSPPPSPPLEHMKISFRPLDSFETSRLKLKYPEGVDNHEITVETFPSFQLVPEPTRLQHDMGSDSDDDTFCRSYPCVSDDSVGHLSDSDSEQWESGDTSESNDHDHAFYDGFRQISSTESSTSQQELAPQLPPLPPLQWRASRPILDDAKAADIGPLGAVDTANLQRGMQESDSTGKQEMVAETKFYDQKQNFPTYDEKTIDDRDDFLNQIRSKSFNLKRTDAARSLYTPILSTSNKVTAILQKASAIRKAVGSDAEDDSWSDT